MLITIQFLSKNKSIVYTLTGIEIFEIDLIKHEETRSNMT